jgi:plastocyanin
MANAKHHAVCMLVTSALAAYGITACQGRSQEGVVIDKSANAPQGTGTGGGTSGGSTDPLAQAAADGVQGLTPAVADTSNASASGMMSDTDWSAQFAAWDGTTDQMDAYSYWSVTDTPATNTASTSSPTPAPAPAPAPPPTTTAPPSTTAAAGLTDAAAMQQLQGCATAGCHDHSADFPDPATAKSSVLKRPDMVTKYAGQTGVDPNAITAWANGTSSSGTSAPPSSTSNSGSSGSTLSLTEDANGNCYNPQTFTGKVGGSVTIVNNCKSGYVVHTNGDPFPHGDVGNPIPPGGSQTYQLQSPVQAGTGNTYRHTDGSDNSATQPLNITVTQ